MSRRPLPMLGPAGPKTAEPEDPLELVGVPVAVDEDTFDDMGRCLIEEYVRDGWTDDRLLALFGSPFYAGLHVVWRRRGEAWVRAELASARLRWHAPDPGEPAHG